MAMVSMLVAHFGGGAVRVDVVDLLGLDAGVLEASAHHAERAVAVFRRAGDVVGVAAHAIAHDLGQNGRAAPLGEFQLFEDQNARAFAHHEAVALRDPRAARLSRVRRCAARARAWRRIRRRPWA